MNQYLLALGANLGDREYYIEQAIEAIRTSCGLIIKRAPLLETEPLGAAQHTFLNTAIVCHSAREPEDLLRTLHDIESRLGRERSVKWGDRTIDCDVILWRDREEKSRIWSSSTLQIPHPEAVHRDFVLQPAAAIAGDWIHPIEDRTILQLWQRLLAIKTHP